MKFVVSPVSGTGHWKNVVLLKTDNWNDYGYVTSLHAFYCDNEGNEHVLGNVKIGKRKMSKGSKISDYLKRKFDYLPEDCFSLWQTAEAYKRVLECEKKWHIRILRPLNDIVLNPNIYKKFRNETVVLKSLFRDVSYSLYDKQFKRIVKGDAILTPYDFTYVINNADTNPLVEDCSLSFSVIPNSLPPTNVHAVIGSNGTGKTTLIRQMIKSICKNEKQYGMFKYAEALDNQGENFENIICITFNPFDDYTEIENMSKVKYIGIRKEYDSEGYEDGYGEISLLDDISKNYLKSVRGCLADETKKDDLQEILEMLEAECNFLSANHGIAMIFDIFSLGNVDSIEKYFDSLSAGHKVVLSIITRCIDELVEKSVVFIDEPENHLHPPLLSALIRSLSEMLVRRNGVAIISTHSPIVLQEIPRSSVWIINREGNTISARRPEIETFGTNIGVLTNEIFGYEVRRTGFNTLLQKTVDQSKDYESVIKKFNNQLGDEAKSIVRIMLKQKEKQ